MEKWDNEKYNEFVNGLYDLADEKYRTFQSRLVPEGLGKMIGVRTPHLKKAAKEIVKNTDWQSFLELAETSTHEEVLVQGLVIGFSKGDIQNRANCLKKFVPKVKNWAVCDMTVAAFKFKKDEADFMYNFIMPYTKSSAEYEVRFAIVFLMSHFIDEEHIDSVIDIYRSIKSDEYYINMAVAWGISMCFVKFPQKTMEFLNNNSLDDFTYNKALQKIIESDRVDTSVKNKMRSMKRKTIGR
ncbi:MAG: DNA alkylation repair protein [Firmicutes bacterium]|nr:DNA alkylation repair protein [Bacillota bacterium]